MTHYARTRSDSSKKVKIPFPRCLYERVRVYPMEQALLHRCNFSYELV